MNELNELHLKPTKSTPKLDFQEGFFSIEGESFPEDTRGFYSPVLEWIDSYFETPYAKDTTKETTFYSNIDYFNTGSRPFVIQIVSRMNDLHKTGHTVKLTWYYDADEGIEEDDVNFKELIDDFVINVEYIPKNK